MTQSSGLSGTPPSGRAGDLGMRILSAAVLAPVVLGAVWFGGWAFVALAALASAILVSEWSGISRSRYVDAAVVIGATAAAVAVIGFAGGFVLAAFLVLVAGAGLAQAKARSDGPASGLWFGVLYGGLPGIALVALRSDPGFGLTAVIWLLVLVWATDIGGYVFGRLIGGPKLAPRLSPKKTWAGFIGGLVAAVGASWLFFRIAELGIAAPIWLAGLLSIVSQLGDLGESAFKRRHDVKDSSRLIPGHGGLMDRIDGLVVVAVLAAAFGILRSGPDAAGAGLLVW